MNLRNLTFFSLFFLTETNERLSAWMIFGAEKRLSVIIGRGGEKTVMRSGRWESERQAAEITAPGEIKHSCI